MNGLSARFRFLGEALNTVGSIPYRRLPSRNSHPYATHVPVLIGIAQLLPVHRVLEIGSGIHSTPLFLNRRVFPGLQSLETWEANDEWFATISELVDGDTRVLLRRPPVDAGGAGCLDGRHVDLIFIDNAEDWRERVRTISAVIEAAEALSPRPYVIVIHDYEFRPYRVAARAVRDRFWFSALNPGTGLIWSGQAIHSRELKRVDSVVRRHAGIACTDVDAWSDVLNTFRRQHLGPLPAMKGAR